MSCDPPLVGTSLRSRGGESLEAAVKEVADKQTMAVTEGELSLSVKRDGNLDWKITSALNTFERFHFTFKPKFDKI